MLDRVLDDTYAADVREHVTLLAGARFTTNTAYRFAVPFLATIASGLGVSLARLGVGLAITELMSLSAPLIGRFVETIARRTAMTAGLVTVAAGAAIAASARTLPLFVVGLAIVSVGKVGFDVTLGAWIADRVPFARRSRVIGLTETTWAIGLLAGVSLLGLVVAASSFHVAYVVVAVVVLAAAAAVHRELPHEKAGERQTHGRTVSGGAGRVPARLVVLTALTLGALAGSSQFMFVTYGSWLADRFGFSPTRLAAVAFGLGGLELMSSLVSVGRTDRWGKERCVQIGVVAMVPGALIVALGAHHIAFVLAGLGVFLMGFELAIISGLPLGAELTPDSPGTGLGTLIGACTTMRALVAIPATAWFDAHGITWPAIGAVIMALAAGACVRLRHRVLDRSAAAATG